MLEPLGRSLDGLVGYLRSRPRGRASLAVRAAKRRPISRPFVGLEELDDRVAPATFTVFNTGDNGGVNPTPGQGTGTLRQAIVDANAAPGADVIDFSVNSGGPATILTLAALPNITDTVNIDATTQPFFAGTPLIVLDGTKAVGSSGLVVTNNAGTSIRGLVIQNFDGAGIVISSGSSGVTIAGNYIGTNITGTTAAPNGTGIQFTPGALGGDTIGGPTATDRNLISGNAGDGIVVDGTVGVLVQNNFIGTDAAGAAAVPNVNGVVLVNGSTAAQILGNLISGNTDFGIFVHSGSDGATVAGNNIGLNLNNTAPLGSGTGVHIESANNTIGGTTAADRNIVTGHFNFGVRLFGPGATGNAVRGNYIGVASDGVTSFVNGSFGVLISDGANGNTIGGTTPADRNVISGYGSYGVVIDGAGTSGNAVSGNYIGTDATGTIAVPSGSGVLIESAATNNTIGGAAGAGNVISGNALFGVEVRDVGTTGNAILGNIIGLTAAGDAALANGGVGVTVSDGAADTKIRNNVVSGNLSDGIFVTGAGTTGAVIAGNLIGTNAAGTAAIGNGGNGVFLFDVGGTLIGGPALADRNVISGNASDGIAFEATAGIAGPTVQNNFIGTNAAGTAALGNTGSGVNIGPVIGTVTGVQILGNVISGNKGISGVFLGAVPGQSDVPGAVIAGNAIGTSADGSAAIPNAGNGVTLQSVSAPLVGGATGAERNLISGNKGFGVVFVSFGTADIVGPTIQGNFIGTNVGGTAAIPNGLQGVRVVNTSAGTDITNVQILGNVVSGNAGDGVELMGTNTGADIPGAVIAGNLIGVGADGSTKIGNAGDGIDVQDVTGTLIGGPTAADRNVVSGNGGYGILYGSSVTGTIAGPTIQNNFVGTNQAGTAAVANKTGGILVSGSGAELTIAGVQILGNVASGNFNAGITLFGINGSSDVPGAIIRGNFVGTSADGSAALPNIGDGLVLQDVSGTVVGGPNPADRNVVSGNTGNGIVFGGTTAIDGPTVQNNYVGTNAAGTAALANGASGVILTASGNVFGVQVLGNLVSGNTGNGVFLLASGSGDMPGAKVQGNFVGTNFDGTAAIPNNFGIALLNVGKTLVGGPNAADRNVVSGNKVSGVFVTLSGVGLLTGPTIQNNYLGTNAAGTAALANGDAGVAVSVTNGNVENVQILGNLISGNTLRGVLLSAGNPGSSDVAGAKIQGNLIGTNFDGTAAIGNGIGIDLRDVRGTLVGGPNAADRNVISGNADFGVAFSSTGPIPLVGPVVQNNYIGTDKAGTGALGNGGAGVGIFAADAPVTGVQVLGNVIAANASDGINVGGTPGGGDVPGAKIQGNFIGTDATGTDALGNGGYGIALQDVSATLVGGPNPADRNVIGGNALKGILFESNAIFSIAGPVVQNNYIGTNAAGTAALPNSGTGVGVVALDGSVTGVQILGNVISGNLEDGVSLEGIPDAADIPGAVIRGNFIGTTADGSAALGNGDNGIELKDVTAPVIGGPNPADRNVIGGNGGNGVSYSWTDAPPVAGPLVQNNFIGTNAAGTAALPNIGAGVIVSATNGPVTGVQVLGNVISGNQGSGVILDESPGASIPGAAIRGNLIGTTADGSAAVPNTGAGIELRGTSGTQIGGPNPADRNVISGNSSAGILGFLTESPGVTGPVIRNNYIGTNKVGTAALPNLGGINLTASTGTVPNTQIVGNVISGNFGSGIDLNGTPGVADLPGVTIRGNLIGTTADGKAALGNSGSGVFIDNVSGTIVGGPAAADRNVISASGVDGVFAPGLSVAGPVVQNNYIGTDITGTVALGNSIHGVDVSTGSGNVTGVRIIDNLISGSGSEGIFLAGGFGTDIPNAVVQGNFIGTNAAGTAALGNRAGGIRASGISGLQIGGTKAGQGNVISGNAFFFGAGVVLVDVTNATLEGNRIGTTADGSAPLPNPNGGISITASSGATSVVIGGTGAKADNLVVQTDKIAALSVATPGTGTALVTILGNRITGFTTGIRFNSAASSPSVNEGIVAPTLRPVTAIPGGVRLTGRFTGMPNQEYRIEYFSDQNFATLLGSQVVTTDGAGVAALSFDAAGAFPTGTAFSAIATRAATGASSVYALTVPPAPPVTNPDSFTTLQNQTLTVPAPGVLTNDTDPEGGPLTATLQTPPPATQGTVTVNPDGSFAFVPAAGFFGQTSFTYLATNSLGLSTPGTVTVTVTQTVFPPVAVNQSYTTEQGVTLNVPPPGVLTGATGGSGPLSAVLIGGLTPAEAGTLTLNSDGSFTYVPDPAFAGVATFQYAATDGVLTSNHATATITVTPVVPPVAARLIAAGAGAGGPPRVRVFDPNGKAVFDFLAFEENFTGGVRVATGDVTGDGTDDIVVAAGPTGGPRVRVFDGRTGQLVRDFFAYDPALRGGVYVAVGDMNGDGIGEIITGAGSLGAPHVVVFDGATGAVLRSFFAYSPAFLGGVRVAAGDLNGDGIADLVTAPGPGGGPHVRAFDGATGEELASYFGVESTYQAGLFVSVIPAHGEGGRGSIVVGRDSFPDFEGSVFVFLNDPGTGGAGLPTTAGTLTGPATIGVFGFNPAVPGGVDDPATTTAYPDDYLGGVRVASNDDGSGSTRIVAAPGQNGGSLIRVFDFADGEFTLVNEFPAFDPDFTGSVYVG